MITSIIKKVFNSKDRVRIKKLEELDGLPADRAEKHLGRFLFDICVENAVSFVTEEHSREGSLFRKPHKHKLFHEMMAINFWLVDKKFSKTNKSIIGEMHNLYTIAYSESGEHFIAVELLSDKYKAYHDLWNDITGHQDQFGLKATEFIFGDVNGVPVEQTSFWIISHADEAMKTFSDIKKRCRNMGKGK